MDAAPRTNGPLFAGLLAAFVVLHHWKQVPLDEPVAVTAVRAAGALAAFALFARPNRLDLLLLTAGGQVLSVLALLPWMSNSWMAAGCFSVGVLAAGLPAFAAGERTVDGAWEGVRAAVAPALVAFYGFAALCKFNLDFMDPGPSCAADFWRELAKDLPLPTAPWAEVLAIGVTLVAEAGIPLLFLFGPTRTAGIAVGLLFHGFIAVSPRVHIFDFSLLMYTGYVALAPADLLATLRTDARCRAWRAIGDRRLLLGAGVVTLAGVAALAGPRLGWTLTLFARALVWDALAAVLVSGGLLALAIAARPGPVPRLATAAGWLATGLVCANGASPYLGLKTTVSFTMFSNLRTEDGFENHAFLPPVRLFPLQEGLVEILASDLPDLPADPGIRYVPFDLRQRLAAHPDARLRVRQDGVEREVRVGDDPELGSPPHPLLARLLSFRPVDVRSRSCQW